MNNSIPLVDLHAQYAPLKERIHTAWDEILDGMHLFLGPNLQSFEKEFAAYCGAAEAIGVGDGTAALYLALRACEVGPGDEVITVSHTFVATSEAICMAGARPVFVDVDPVTLTMDPSQIEDHISPRTRAILPVHLYGQCADMDPILEIANRHGLYVIEDACQAHGAEYHGRRAGSLGSLAAFSFYYSKNLGAYGEGGMVTTNDPELGRKVRMLRDHGSSQRYYHDLIGMNGRLDELQAAVLRIKLECLEGWNEQRRMLAGIYQQALASAPVLTPVEAAGRRHIYHLYAIRSQERDRLRDALASQGIGTGIHYPVPVHLQVAYQHLGEGRGSLPVTEAAAEEILSLPMYAELLPSQVERVAAEVQSFLLRVERG